MTTWYWFDLSQRSNVIVPPQQGKITQSSNIAGTGERFILGPELYLLPLLICQSPWCSDLESPIVNSSIQSSLNLGAPQRIHSTILYPSPLHPQGAVVSSPGYLVTRPLGNIGGSEAGQGGGNWDIWTRSKSGLVISPKMLLIILWHQG